MYVNVHNCKYESIEFYMICTSLWCIVLWHKKVEYLYNNCAASYLAMAFIACSNPLGSVLGELLLFEIINVLYMCLNIKQL